MSIRPPAAGVPAGRQTASEFARANLPSLYRLALSLCGNPTDAEDLVSEAMARALPHWDQITSSPMAYLRRSMVNIRLNERRRRQQQCPMTVPRVADAELAVIERLRLEHILGGLDAMERVVLVLRFLQDMPVRAVARELACSSVTVRRLVRRALASARRAEGCSSGRCRARPCRSQGSRQGTRQGSGGIGAMSTNRRYARSLSRRLHQVYDAAPVPADLNLESMAEGRTEAAPLEQASRSDGQRNSRPRRQRWWPVVAAVVAVLVVLAVIVATRPFGSTPPTPPAGGSSNPVTLQVTSQPVSAAHDTAGHSSAESSDTSPVGFTQACGSPTGPTVTTRIATGGDEEITTESPAKLFISSAPAGSGYLCLHQRQPGPNLRTPPSRRHRIPGNVWLRHIRRSRPGRHPRVNQLAPEFSAPERVGDTDRPH